MDRDAERELDPGDRAGGDVGRVERDEIDTEWLATAYLGRELDLEGGGAMTD